VGVFPGTGIGGGCVYEGRILRGRNRSCMEIGHVQVVPYGPLCGCGQRGCLETVAGRMAIAAEAAKAAFRGDAPHLMEIAGADLTKIRSGALAASIKAGEKVIERIVREAAGRIGVAVASVVHLLAPDVVVLGGGLVEAMPELFVNGVAKTANKHVMPSYIDSFRVVPCQLGDDAVLLGAAAWAREMIKV
jgi:glucokinase